MATVAESVAADKLLTLEEYGAIEDLGQPSELVQGRIVEMNVPYYRHGEVCAEAALIIGGYVKQHQLGRITTNDSGVVTQRGPDTVRGADFAFYSKARLPEANRPSHGYAPVPPDLVVEVRSPRDPWAKVNAKISEYLDAGVRVVLILDPEFETAQVHFVDKPPRTLTHDDILTLPEVLGDFQVAVKQFFE